MELLPLAIVAKDKAAFLMGFTPDITMVAMERLMEMHATYQMMFEFMYSTWPLCSSFDEVFSGSNGGQRKKQPFSWNPLS